PLLLFCHRHPPPNCYPFSLHDALPISRGRTTVVALQRGHVQRERGEILEQHVARADRGQGRERLEVSAAAVTYLDGVALQAVRRHQGAQLFVIALATEETAQPLGAPVAAAASAAKLPSAVESADVRQRR